jgi:hypothetical protein
MLISSILQKQAADFKSFLGVPRADLQVLTTLSVPIALRRPELGRASREPTAWTRRVRVVAEIFEVTRAHAPLNPNEPVPLEERFSLLGVMR